MADSVSGVVHLERPHGRERTVAVATDPKTGLAPARCLQVYHLAYDTGGETSPYQGA